ncbi:MAG: SDR family NAD(P)-dependent oxidoreductase [Gemmataceae bacterium]
MNQEHPSPPEPLAIIGIGCLFPQADHLGAYWSNIKNGVDAITPIPPTHWSVTDYFDPDPKAPDRCYAQRGGFLNPIAFTPLQFGIAPNDLEATDTAQLLGLVVAEQALRDAGYGPERAFDRSRVSVILGVTGTLELVIPLGARLGHPIWRKALKEAGVPDAVAEDVVRRIAGEYVDWQENSFPGLLGNVVAGRIANRLNLGGTNCVVDAACASSLSAIHLAALELTSGRADMVLTGGVDTFNDIFMYMCFSKTPALSPSGDARPFDQGGDGTILGEGLGMIVLKRWGDARRDGDRIYAVIRGMGTSSDGKGNAVYAPNADGQKRALRAAYHQARVTPDTIELVEAHGTGTRVGDATEATALAEVYRAAGSQGTWCALGSVKSQIGHTKAAAGAAGLIKAALALHHKVLPPTIKVQQPLDPIAPGQSPFYVNTEKRPWLPVPDHPRRAAVSSFGFGGSNFHCVLEEAEPHKKSIDWEGNVEIVTFACYHKSELLDQLRRWSPPSNWEELRQQADQTRRAFRPSQPYRLAFVIEKDRTDLPRLLANAQAMLQKDDNPTSWQTPDGAYCACNQTPEPLAFLFPGQGSQYVGMLRDLACQFPVVQEALTQANAIFASDAEPGERLSDAIYPYPAFTTEDREEQERRLRSTRVAQPAIGAVSLGAMRLLEQFGIHPQAVAGHSYGELTALCAAGCLETEAFLTLSRERGRLMAEVPGDSGAMLAVHAALGTVTEVLRAEKLDLTIANKNAPNQVVLSGPSGVISRAVASFGQRRLRATRLPVSAAFHSSLVAEACEPFRTILERTPFRPPRIPAYSNSTGRLYPADGHAARTLLAKQLAQPVEFVAEIEDMAKAGVRTFVEVGPGCTLTRLVEAILPVQEHTAIALDASTGKRPGCVDLAHLLARLAMLGYPVRLTLWEDGNPPRLPKSNDKPTLTVLLCGANYVKSKVLPTIPPKYELQEQTVPASTSSVSSSRETAILSEDKALATIATSSPRSDVIPKQVSASVPRQLVDSQPTSHPQTDKVMTTNFPPSALTQALKITQDSLAAFQKMQEQTAQVHRQFLEGQDAAQKTLHLLIEQQQQLVLASLGQTSSAPMLQTPTASPATLSPSTISQTSLTPKSTPIRQEPSAPVQTDIPADDEQRSAILSSTTSVPPSAVSMASLSAAQTVLLDVVAEKTGYPADMLDLDMNLDTDLGIDSIKRVEIFAALQEKLPEAPAVKPEHLGTLHTLRQVVGFLTQSTNEFVSSGSLVSRSTETSAKDDQQQIQQILVEVIAEKTGYPTDMLELDMVLDTDLGIDSIKRVEIFAALQEQLPNRPAVQPEQLGTLHTIRQVLDFLTATPKGSDSSEGMVEQTIGPSTDESVIPPLNPTIENADGWELLERHVLTAVEFDGTSGRQEVCLPNGAEIVLVSDGVPLAQRLEERLRMLGYRCQRISWGTLPDLSFSQSLSGLIMLAPIAGTTDTWLRHAFGWLQASASALRRAGQQREAIFITISRMDGAFGLLDLDVDQEPLSGGLAGLVKTASLEWPEVTCKALDVTAAGMDDDEAAAAISHEMFLSGPCEVGISAQGRWTLQLTPSHLPSSSSLPLEAGDVILISGGGRGVTAEAALALARACRPTLVLLGRSPEPGTEPDWLAGLTHESEIKRVLREHSPASATPRQIGEQYQTVIHQREIRHNLNRIAATGAPVYYRSVDVRDAAAVHQMLTEIRQSLGPIRGFIHGAGVIADRRIEDKSEDQFKQVYDTKIVGLRTILRELTDDDLRILALFSSSTARFGRVGQVDYAVANEVLNKIAQQQARLRPHCRVVSINWGPWAGGMVTPSLRDLFQKEGIGLIPLAAGARYFLEELSVKDRRPVEVVVMGRSQDNLSSPSMSKPSNSLQVVLERELEIHRFPVLRSHVIDGRAVVPVALLLEWLAHAAMHAHPGLRFHGCDDLRVLHGILLEEGDSYSIHFLSGKARKQGDLFHVPVELRGIRGDGKEVHHTRADIVLTTEIPRDHRSLSDVQGSPYARSLSAVYSDILFHGPHWQGVERIESCGPQGIQAVVRTAPPPTDWIEQPLRGAWLADPLVLDSSFQLMVLWSMEQYGCCSLPCYLGSYRQFTRAFPQGEVRVVAHVSRATEKMARVHLEYLDGNGRLLACLRDYECVIDAGLNQSFRRNQLSVTTITT